MRNPFIDVKFGNGQTIQTVPEVYQYDHGQKLHIYGFSSDDITQIQYSHTGLSNVITVIPTQEEDRITADIPDVLLMQSKEIQCYVYVEKDVSGITVYEIHIPIHPRAKPSDVTFTPGQVDNYGKQVSELNKVVDEVSDIKSDLTKVTDDAKEATNQAEDAAANAEAVSRKFNDLQIEVESLPATSEPTGSISQTDNSTTFNIGIPVSNFAYATFEVNPDDGCLYMKAPDSLTAVTFHLDYDGELCVSV